MKRVIVNADDFGLHPAVTAGVLRAAESGIVSSTTVLANLCPDRDLKTLRQSGLACGLHVNLVEGAPVTGTEGLEPILDGNGKFKGIWLLARAATLRQLDADRLLEEVWVQTRVLLDAGIRVVHLDGHQHAHLLPVVSDVTAQVARKIGASGVRLTREPLRFAPVMWKATLKKLLILLFAQTAARKFAACGLRMPTAFFGIALLESRDPRRLVEKILARLPEGVTEIALHLAAGDCLDASTGHLAHWARTLDALLEMDFAQALADAGGVLTTFAEIDAVHKPSKTDDRTCCASPLPKTHGGQTE